MALSIAASLPRALGTSSAASASSSTSFPAPCNSLHKEFKPCQLQVHGHPPAKVTRQLSHVKCAAFAGSPRPPVQLSVTRALNCSPDVGFFNKSRCRSLGPRFPAVRTRKRAASRERQPLISYDTRCAAVQQAHPEKLANAELAERLACFYLGGLLQALNRFLGHFVVLFF